MVALDFPNSPTVGQEFNSGATVFVWTGTFWRVKFSGLPGDSLSNNSPTMNGSASAGVAVTGSRSDHVHPTDTSRAPINSPTFTGTPTAPTAAADTNTTQIATTAFVINQGYAKTSDLGTTFQALDSDLTNIANINTGTGLLKRTNGVGYSLDTTAYAPLASPTFTGTPAAPTAAADTNTTQVATTAFVVGQGYLKSSTASSTYAPISSPALTGTPTAPTAAADTSTTQIATTGFVINQGYLKSTTASSTYQPLDGDLTAIAALTGNGVLNRTGTNTWELIVPQDYLTVAAAASTYLTIANAASTYLTSATAASTYLTSATAATTYAPLASPAFTGTPTTTYQRIIPTGTKPTYTEGNLFYHNEEKTVIIQGSQGFEIPVGQREWARVRNGTASTITKGSVVYAVGVHIAGDPIHGHHISIDLADASDINKIDVLGIVAEDIAAGDHGYVVVRGHIENMNTSGLTAGTRIHLSATTPGGLVDTAPTYPNYPVDLGRCLTSSATVGGIYVDIQPHTIEGLRVTGNGYIDGNFTVGGDLSILGSSSSISTSNLAVANNFIYLNSGDTIGAAGTSFTGSGLDDATLVGHYTGTTTKTFKVKIVSTGPDKFRWSTDNFATDNGSDITITAATPQALSDNISVEFVAGTGHTVNDIWSGTAAPLNVDLALIGNRNTGTTGVGYTHTGLFFDVSDAKFKVFDEYDPEPSVNIDTTDVSFSLATLVADTFEGSLIGNVTGNVSGNITGNAATVTNGVYTTGSYANPSWITSLAWSKISSTPTTLSGYGISDAQPLDADLTAIATLAGTSGFLKKTAADSWTLDTNTYLTSSTGVTSVNGSTGSVTGLATTASPTFTGLVTISTNTAALFLSGTPSATPSTDALLEVGTLSWQDTDIIANFAHTVNSYAQVVVQNKSSGTTASADVIVSNNTGSASSTYGDFGINSSGFTGASPWNDPNGTYLYANGGTLTIGTQGTASLRFVTNNTLQASIDSSGNFTSTTAPVDTNSTRVATTAFVIGQGYLKSADYTASDVLTKLLTVDGATSNLDADLLDGQQGTYYTEEVVTFTRTANAAVSSGQARFRFPFAATIQGISAAIATAPTGANLIIDINKNGSTIFTNQANRPTIVAGTNEDAEVTNMDITSMAIGDYLTVDIDQIGSTVPGADLTVMIRYRRA